MRVQDVMTRGVFTIAPTLPAEDGYNLMRTRGVHHLVVADEGGVAGVLSERDTGGRQGSSVRRNRTVAELMTPRVVTVPPTTTVRKAANLMRGRSIGCLVVTDRNRIVGIVTVADLLELVGRGVDRPVASTTRWTLKHRAPHRKRHRAAGVW
jgi:CBS domain-containing protein